MRGKLSAKKLFAGALCALVLAVALSACSKLAKDGTDDEGSGWKVNGGALEIDENADAKAAFEKALEGRAGAAHQPLCLLGTRQTEAGTDYCVLAKSCVEVPDASVFYTLVYITEAPDGSARLRSVQSLADAVGVSDEKNIVGGWAFRQEDIAMSANDAASAAFAAATADLDDGEYEAIGCLASQVVAGMNYSIACRVFPAGQQDAELRLVVVYAALDGSAEVTAQTTIDLAALENAAAS